MTVYAKQYGRLGNNLFQKAAAVGYAIKYGHEVSLSTLLCENVKTPFIKINESGHQYQELPAPNKRNADVILQGYWQSEKYFAHCRKEVLQAFGCKWEHIPNVCSIHLRRGDYLLYPDKHPVITADYLDQAIKHICEATGVNNFLVFSDDIPFTRQLIESRLFYRCSFEYSVNLTEIEDLEFMSCCAHNIIANSSFSWWGAWLNQNPDKVVVSPSKDNWFGPGNSNLDTSDLIPDSWIQIKY